MIGYRRGYSLQQLEDMTLPSVATFQATPMLPSVARSNVSTIFQFDQKGNSVTLCNGLGQIEDGYGTTPPNNLDSFGMASTQLRYGIDYAVFESGTIVDVTRIVSTDYVNGSVTFVPVAGKVYTCNYYKRMLNPNIVNPLPIPQDFLPSIYTVGILSSRLLGQKFSNLS